MISTLFLEIFTLTFLAEWGDRSQLTTIMLAARENIYGVVIGTILGHAFCTGIAVVGGRLVATHISVRTSKDFEYNFLYCAIFLSQSNYLFYFNIIYGVHVIAKFTYLPSTVVTIFYNLIIRNHSCS